MLTVPAGVSRRRALAWAAGHEEWAREAVGRQSEATALVPGASVPLFGVPHAIDWSGERSRRVVRAEGRLVCGGPPWRAWRGGSLRWLRARRWRCSGRRRGRLRQRRREGSTRVAVGDPRSRWGSCSSAARSATAGG
jgi:predicted metal-dependent hydrolase